MRTAGLRRLGMVMGLVGSLASCSGAGDDPTHAFQEPLQGGIWHGTDTLSGLTVYGLANESGEFRFMTSNGTAFTIQYAGSITNDKTILNASFQGFAMVGTFSDSTTHGTGAFGGRMNPGVSMLVNTAFVTDAVGAPVQEGAFDLKFDEAYRRPSSIGRISGNFAAGNDTLSVSGAGIVTGQSTTSGCIINGTVEAPDPLHNLYSLSLEYANCTSTVPNGTYTGLATLDDSESPQRLVGALDNGAGFAIALVLNRM
jgi:hypothetical protein